MEKNDRIQLILYSVLHFCVDWACILLITGQVRLGLVTHGQWLWCILLYNAAAFALQLPLGAALDLLGRGRLCAGLGCLLVGAGWLCRGVGLLPCLVAGVGNALFHLGGGAEVLAFSAGRAAPSGVFVSTGAVGVWLGVRCAQRGLTGLWLPLGVMAAGAVLAALLPPRSHKGKNFHPFPKQSLPSAPSPTDHETEKGPVETPKGPDETLWRPSPDGQKALFLGCFCLFLTVCLRSWAGGLMAFSWKTGWLSLAGVLCVAGGKAAGGVLGDRFGWKAASALTLGASALLFLLAFSHPWAGLLALFLFNTSMPLTLAALAGALGLEHRGLAFGLTTFAIFLGALPDLLPPMGPAGPWALCAGAAVSAGLLWAGAALTGQEAPKAGGRKALDPAPEGAEAGVQRAPKGPEAGVQWAPKGAEAGVQWAPKGPEGPGTP